MKGEIKLPDKYSDLILLALKDMKAVGMKNLGHNHSQLLNSPLGPKDKLSKKDREIFFKLINDKFAIAK